MSKIYVGQTSLQIQALTDVDITGALSLQIKYRKPDNTEGLFSAVSLDDSEGTIAFDVDSDDCIDQAGVWHFWAYVTFADGKVAPGEAYTVRVYNEGE